jgi:hypothetical protein
VSLVHGFPKGGSSLMAMERRRPENISLPPMRNIFERTLTGGNHNGGGGGGGGRHEGETWYSGAPKTAPLLPQYYPPVSPYPSDRAPRICGQHRPTTPPSNTQRSGRIPHVYPSPASDHHLEDTEMGEGGSQYLGTITTPLFSNHEDDHHHPVPQRKLSSVEMQRHPAPLSPKTDLLTPSIVHYRPEGIPAARPRRPSIQKSGTKKSTELKIRMVKWDRLTDKGTAPLKTEPKSATPRACTLCHFTRRKVPPYSLL